MGRVRYHIPARSNDLGEYRMLRFFDLSITCTCDASTVHCGARRSPSFHYLLGLIPSLFLDMAFVDLHQLAVLYKSGRADPGTPPSDLAHSVRLSPHRHVRLCHRLSPTRFASLFPLLYNPIPRYRNATAAPLALCQTSHRSPMNRPSGRGRKAKRIGWTTATATITKNTFREISRTEFLSTTRSSWSVSFVSPVTGGPNGSRSSRLLGWTPGSRVTTRSTANIVTVQPCRRYHSTSPWQRPQPLFSTFCLSPGSTESMPEFPNPITSITQGSFKAGVPTNQASIPIRSSSMGNVPIRTASIGRTPFMS